MPKYIPSQNITLSFLLDILYNSNKKVFTRAIDSPKNQIFCENTFPERMRCHPDPELNQNHIWKDPSRISKIMNRSESQPKFTSTILKILNQDKTIIHNIIQHWAQLWNQYNGNLSFLHHSITKRQGDLVVFLDANIIGPSLSLTLVKSENPAQILTILSIFALVGNNIHAVQFDWENCAEYPSQPENTSHIEMKSYQDLLKMGLDSYKICETLIKNDAVLYHLEENHPNEGNAGLWNKYLQSFPDSFEFLMDGTNIIGNYSMVVLSEELEQKLLKGELYEASLSLDQTPFLGPPQNYVLYILNLSVNLPLNTPENYNILLNAFWAKIEKYAKQGIFFKKVYTNLIREDHISLYKTLGAKFVVKNKKCGTVYGFEKFPQQLKCYNRDTLMRLYKNMHNETISNSHLTAPAPNSLTAQKRYAVITGGKTTEWHVAQTVVLDKIAYEEKYWVPVSQCLDWFHTNRDIYILIEDTINHTIAGYINVCPVLDETYDMIHTGDFQEINITSEQILSYDFPGAYDIFFFSIVIHPDYRNTEVCPLLINAVIDKFLSLSTRGIFIKRLMADAVSNEGKKFCTMFGMNKVKESTHGSDLYEVQMTPPEFRIFSKKAKELYDQCMEIYMEEPYLFE